MFLRLCRKVLSFCSPKKDGHRGRIMATLSGLLPEINRTYFNCDVGHKTSIVHNTAVCATCTLYITHNRESFRFLKICHIILYMYIVPAVFTCTCLWSWTLTQPHVHVHVHVCTAVGHEEASEARGIQNPGTHQPKAQVEHEFSLWCEIRLQF